MNKLDSLPGVPQMCRQSSKQIARLVGAISVFFSIFSILLSVAMPGVGWVIAAINLVLASLLTPTIGRRMLGACVALTVIHLFSFGPLSGPQALHGSPFYFALIFVLAPMVAALAAIVVPIWRARKR